jgi:hypothetical protein
MVKWPDFFNSSRNISWDTQKIIYTVLLAQFVQWLCYQNLTEVYFVGFLFLDTFFLTNLSLLEKSLSILLQRKGFWKIVTGLLSLEQWRKANKQRSSLCKNIAEAKVIIVGSLHDFFHFTLKSPWTEKINFPILFAFHLVFSLLIHM